MRAHELIGKLPITAGKEQEDDPAVDRNETDPYNEVIFGRRRPGSVAVDWTRKILYVLEFKRTSDQRQDYRERWESRARAQHDVLVKSLKKAAGEAGENEGWKVKLIIFVGGTCGSVHDIQQQSQGTVLGLSNRKET